MTKRPIYYEYAGAYDFLFMGNVENQGDFIFEQLRDRRMLGKIDLLEAGCGTGWLALEISKKGFKVTGIDKSAAMISESTKKRTCAWPPPVFWTGDVLELPDAYKFHCILARNLLDDIPDREEQLDYLKRFFSMLNPNGLIFFDAINWDFEKKETIFSDSENLSLKGGTFSYSTQTKTDDDKQVLIVEETCSIEKGDDKKSDTFELKIPCWTRQEIEKALQDIGFASVEIFGNYDPETKADIQERLVVVAQK